MSMSLAVILMASLFFVGFCLGGLVIVVCSINYINGDTEEEKMDNVKVEWYEVGKINGRDAKDIWNDMDTDEKQLLIESVKAVANKKPKEV